jgi:hypothetical protein
VFEFFRAGLGHVPPAYGVGELLVDQAVDLLELVTVRPRLSGAAHAVDGRDEQETRDHVLHWVGAVGQRKYHCESVQRLPPLAAIWSRSSSLSTFSSSSLTVVVRLPSRHAMAKPPPKMETHTGMTAAHTASTRRQTAPAQVGRSVPLVAAWSITPDTTLNMDPP